jgi:tRNA pseudouridine38-40 synthase
MPRYKITVAYDGTHYNGWQKQQRICESELADASGDESRAMATARRCENEVSEIQPSAPLRTVQDALEHAVREVVREPVQVVGASRTDSGVHARAQVAAFTTTTDIPVEKLPRAITSRCPPDLQVRKAELVHDTFDPIKHAIAKAYRYRIAFDCARRPRPLFDRNFIAHVAQPLDVERMNEAARLLLGEHDFTSFARLHHGRETAMRTIFECTVDWIGRPGSRRGRIDVVGGGFLYNMVRIIAGTLVEVGRGRIEPDAIPAILAARNRSAAGPTMPPEGLSLRWIRYPVESVARGAAGVP